MVGLVVGSCVLTAAALIGGTAGAAFLALGLTLPGLMLQDSWRYSFFALGRGSQAFLNDTDLGGGPAAGPGAIAGNRACERVLVRSRMGRRGGRRRRGRAAAGPGRTQAVGACGTGYGSIVTSDSATSLEGTSACHGPAAQLRNRHRPRSCRSWLRAGGRHAHGSHHDPLPWHGPGAAPGGRPDSAAVRRSTCRCSACSSAPGCAAASLAWGVVLLVVCRGDLGPGCSARSGGRPIRWCCRRCCSSSARASRVAPASACTPWGPRGGACARPILTLGYLSRLRPGRCVLGRSHRDGARCRGRGLAGSAAAWWQLRAALRESGQVPAGHRIWSGTPDGQHRRPGLVRSSRPPGSGRPGWPSRKTESLPDDDTARL